jgi:zinc protease
MTRTLFISLIAVPVLVAQTAAPRIPASYKDIKFPPLNAIKVPPVTRAVLPNGMTLFLVEDKELPLVRASAIIRTGERWEPIAKTGLAEITMYVMRQGGSVTRDGDALDKELDRLAASVEISPGTNSSGASMFVLKEDTDKGLEILADLLQHPAFPQDKIDLLKLQINDAISRRNDDVGSIHSRESTRLLYGKDSPYAHVAEFAHIAGISRADLVAFHQQYFQPENVILGITGDFNAADMKAKVEKAFGTWAKGGKPKPVAPAVDLTKTGKPGIYYIEKDDVNQSTIGTSILLGKANDPDYQAMSVMTYILGGSFGSRLTNTIRTREGLAYSTSAGYGAGFDYAGGWSANVGTKSQTTVKALELLKAEIERIKTAEVTDDELAQAKEYILKGEAFDNDSTDKILGRLMTYEYYGYPSDFMQRHRAAIEKVTKADVLRVAKQYLDLSKFQTVVLGNAKDFDKPLSSLGPVTTLDITIPAPPAQP